jgi:hypothetical protein
MIDQRLLFLFVGALIVEIAKVGLDCFDRTLAAASHRSTIVVTPRSEVWLSGRAEPQTANDDKPHIRLACHSIMRTGSLWHGLLCAVQRVG